MKYKNKLGVKAVKCSNFMTKMRPPERNFAV